MLNEGYLNYSADSFIGRTSRHVVRFVKKSKIKQLSQKIETVVSPFYLWNHSLKSIEKNCGCGVVSYFHFIAWLLKINIMMLVTVFSILIIPYLLTKPDNFDELCINNQYNNTSNKFTKTLACTKNVIVDEDLGPLNLVLNIFQGKGQLEKSPVFIGFYFNKSFFNSSSNQFTKSVFNTPLAYGIAFGLCILISLLATLYSSGHNYKNYLVDETEFKKSFGLSIFAGYDYRITKENKIIHSRNTLSKKLKIEYQQNKENTKRSMLSTNQICLIYFTRFIINLLFVGFLLFVYGAIAFAQDAPTQLLKYEVVNTNQILSLLVDYIPAMAMLAINSIFPMINNKIVILEKYRSTFAMGVCLKRVIMVQATALLIFMVTLLDQIKDSDSADHICQQTNAIKCWETFVGQQFYRLSLLGFITAIFVGPLMDLVTVQLYLRKADFGLLGPTTFDLSTEGFLLIKSQTECWMGLWFCPFLPLILAVKLILVFYIRKMMFIRNYFVPSIETLSVAGGRQFFQDMLSYSLAFVMLPMGYLLSKKCPSRGCSPFRIYDGPDGEFSFTGSLREYLASISSFTTIVLNVLESRYVTVIIIFILLIIIYVKYAESKTQIKYQSILRKQIIMTQKDKIFYDTKSAKINEVLKKQEVLLKQRLN